MEVSEELELSGMCLEGPQVNQSSRKPNGEALEVLRTKHTKDKRETRTHTGDFCKDGLIAQTRHNSKASYHFARLAEARFGSMFLFQGGRHRLRWLTLLSGLVENLFFGGIVFGWASLVFALKADGYFAEYCVNVTRVEDNAVSIDCSGQDEHFSRVMSVASIGNTAVRFPIGYIFDRY